METGRNAMVVIGVLLVTAALGFAGVGALREADARRQRSATPTEAELGVPVQVAVASLREMVLEVATRGFLEPFERVTVSAEVSGYVQARLIEAADGVEMGDPLFRIDDALLRTALDKALADAGRVRSDLELAAENRRRIEKLMVEESANPTEELQVNTEYAKAEAMVRHADAVVHEARILLDKTVVHSPLTGVVARVHTRGGEYVHAGQPLVDIIEVDRLKLVAQLDDREVVSFAPGDPVTLFVPATPDVRVQGSVLRIYPSAAMGSRRFEVEVQVPNSDRRLRPGFYVEANLKRAEGTPGGPERAARILTIPRIAIIEQYRRQFCYVIQFAGNEPFERVTETPIETVPLLSDPRQVQVVSGLAEGDRVVTTGLQHVTHGCEVRIVE